MGHHLGRGCCDLRKRCKGQPSALDPPRISGLPATPHSTTRAANHVHTSGGWAIYLAATASAVSALLAWAVYHYSASWIRSRLLRFGIALSIVLTPVAGAENTANIANSIWALAAVLPWVLVARQERSKDVAVRASIAFLAATATHAGNY